MAQVTWTPQAVDDLEAICLFVARDSFSMAAAFVDRILRSSERLAEFPRSGRRVPEIGRDHIRELVVGSYRLIYQTRADHVQVLTVHHGARLLNLQRLSK